MRDLLSPGGLERLLAERVELGAAFFEGEAERIARLCERMADRFGAGGRLIALGRSPAARSDARHVAVEFVHPVIVGKRALPAIALVDAVDREVSLLAERDDIVMAFDPEPAVEVARARGCLTIAFSRSGAEWEFLVPSEDPYVRQELAETLYHVLWELVHVFFEGRPTGEARGAGAASFLYPFLSEARAPDEALVEDVRRSVLMKAAEVAELRAQTLRDNERELLAASRALRTCFDAGGKLLTLGNGGSATDAMDAVADFSSGVVPRPAIDLTADPAIITAIANDIGPAAIFARQVIAYGRAGDALLALSTSGNSENVIVALGEARKRHIVTCALVGYDGGRVASEGLADHVVVTRSQHIPRIQEAQASAYHALRELVEREA